MSSSSWVMGVRAPLADVLAVLARWPGEAVARLEPWSADGADEAGWLVFAFAPHDGWTVLRSRPGQGLVPSLVLHVARALQTRVISLDQAETVGYEHFSVVDAGVVSRCFMLDVGEVVESVGVDLRDLHDQGRRSGKVHLPPSFDEEEMGLEAFQVLARVVADIDLQEIAADRVEPVVRLWAGDEQDRAMATLTRTGRGTGPWWKDLA